MQKCYGKNCIVGFLCRSSSGIRGFVTRCDLIDKNIVERVKEIPDNLSDTDQQEMIIDIIFETYTEICNAIEHPYIESLLENLSYHIGDSEGYYFKKFNLG